MDSKVVKIGAARPRAKTYYERFMEKEGIPVVEGFGVTDVRRYPAQILEAARLRRGLSAASRPGRYHGCLRWQARRRALRHSLNATFMKKLFIFCKAKAWPRFQQRDRVPQNIQWQPGQLVFSADEHAASSDELQ